MSGLDPVYYNAPIPAQELHTKEKPLCIIDQFVPASLFASTLYTVAGIVALKTENNLGAIPLFCMAFLSFYKTQAWDPDWVRA